MTKIIIEPEDEIAELLTSLADRHDSYVEQFAKEELTEIALDPKADTRRLARQIVRENRELYKRLS